MDAHDSIAVVGLAANMPKAPHLDAFWQNLVDGVECMSDLSYEDVRARGETSDRLHHKNYVFRRPLLVDMEHFDAGLFGMPPRDAELRDPQHRIFLEVCFSALEHAGYDPARYPGAIGLYAGINANRYVDLHLRQNKELVEAVGELALETTNHPDYVTTFTSYKLGLRGPSMTIATACSSSLVSLHQACQALRLGECDMALAGGVEVEWPYGIGYVHNDGGIYSADGYCRPFDVHADGTVFGSGAGAVLLKRTADALADGDTIHAVVRGSAVNNDGAGKVGFSAPSVAGQAACVAEALAAADVHPGTISYVEAHGTATRLGDPIEVEALTTAYRAVGGDLPTGYCGIGSVKSNVGHLGPASGIAGFIKTVLALRRETIPPNINFTEPNPRLRLDETPFTVVAEAAPWHRRGTVPLRAGVSSFGIGGTNAHVVLEQAPEAAADRPRDRKPELLVLSARTAEALGGLREDVAQHLAWHETDLRDVGHTLRAGRRQFEVRETVVADTAISAASALGQRRSAEMLTAERIVFAFPGQGSQRAGMAAGLRQYSARFRACFDECLAAFSDLLGQDMLALWESGVEQALTDTGVAQPLLFSAEYALSDLLVSLGVPVASVVGHSLGEVVAGAVAGVFDQQDAIRVVAERARLMSGMPHGSMAAVALAQSDVDEYLTGEVALAAVNGSQEVVLSGPSDELARCLERLTADEITVTKLRTSHAYHSSMMREAASGFREMLAGIRMAAPVIPLMSCATGRTADDDQATSPGFWADQLVSPVYFARAARELLGTQQGSVVLEIGPGTALTNLLRATPAVRRGLAVTRPVLGRDREPRAEYTTFLGVLGDLWQSGVEIDLDGLSEPAARRIPLPGYHFQRRRYFVDRPVAEDTVSANDTPVVRPEIEVADEPQEAPVATETTQLLEVTWTRLAAHPTPPAAPGDVQDGLALLPTDIDAAKRMLAYMQRSGLRPVRVRPKQAPGTADVRVDFADRDSVLDFVASLARDGKLPDTIVHGLMFGPRTESDEDEAAGTTSLLWLIQAIQRHRGEAGLGEVRLVVVTSDGADVTGSESVVPGRAMVSGLLRTAELEIDSLRCELLDLGARCGTAAVVQALRHQRHTQAAIRGADVWVPAVRAVSHERSNRQTLTNRGVYLITGGLGALGRFSAKALADTGFNPRLALLSRSAEDRDDAEVTDFVADLELSGAEVELVTADVADQAELEAGIKRIRDRFGPINGVLHAAGVSGDGLLELRTADQVAAVLCAKVDGGRALHTVLNREPNLQFVVHFGSRAALTGLVGSGDYAAANSYLNALAHSSSGGDRQVVSVNWPGWAEAGMAVRGGASDQPGATASSTWTGEEWFLDEHRVAGTPVLPGTGYLDLILTSAVRQGLVAPDHPITVSDLVFIVPLAVARSIEAEVRFVAEGTGFSVAVRSRTSAAAEWTEHARAVLRTTDRPAEDLDVAEFEARLAKGEAVAVDTNGTAVQFGARWRNAERVAKVDSDLVGALALPERFRDDLGGSFAHPALVDIATSIAQESAQQPYLPFHYREATFFRPVPAELYVVNRVTKQPSDVLVADVWLYDRSGREVARIEGFTMRRVDVRDFERSVQTDRPSPKLGQLLAPREGAAMLIRILQSSTPPVVVVLQPGESLGGYVSLDDPPTAAVASPPAPRVSPPPIKAPPMVAPKAEPVAADTGPASVEDRLRVLWERLLGLVELSGDEDFFDVGGTSMAAVQLVSRIRDEFGIQLGVGTIFEAGTINKLATEIRRLQERNG